MIVGYLLLIGATSPQVDVPVPVEENAVILPSTSMVDQVPRDSMRRLLVCCFRYRV